MGRAGNALAGLALGVSLAVGVVPARADTAGSEVDAPVRVTPLRGAVLTVDGAPYRGSLEIGRNTSGGLDVVDVVSVDDYLKGVVEVPPSWPQALLETQAIVTRTQLAHALAPGRRTGADGVDLLAGAPGIPTYRGAASESDEWDSALSATDELVLRVDGRPAEAHSYATSFDDPASGDPLATWSVQIPAGDLGEALSAAGVTVPGHGPPTSLSVEGGDMAIGSAAGETRMSVEAFARAVNNGAPSRFPDRYPSQAGEPVEDGLTGGDGWGGPWPLPPRPEGEPPRLPLTLASAHLDVSADGDSFKFSGRGWGSGLGMSKSAARRAADEGRRREDLLDTYFPGRVVEREQISGDVRVGIRSGVPEVRIGADGGFFSIEASDSHTVASAAFGEWTVSPGRDQAVSLVGPDGADTALVLDGFTVPLRMVSNRRFPIEFSLSRPAQVTTVVSGPLGGAFETRRQDLGILAAGEVHQIGPEDLPPGSYNVSVEASAGDVTVDGGPLTVEVTPVRRGPSPLGALGLVVVLTVLLAGAVAARSRRRLRMRRDMSPG